MYDEGGLVRFVSSFPTCFTFLFSCFFFFNDTATTEIYTLSLHDALPISDQSADVPERGRRNHDVVGQAHGHADLPRSEEHTSELQSLAYLVCRLLLEKKKKHVDSTKLVPVRLFLIPAVGSQALTSYTLYS